MEQSTVLNLELGWWKQVYPLHYNTRLAGFKFHSCPWPPSSTVASQSPVCPPDMLQHMKDTLWRPLMVVIGLQAAVMATGLMG